MRPAARLAWPIECGPMATLLHSCIYKKIALAGIGVYTEMGRLTYRELELPVRITYDPDKRMITLKERHLDFEDACELFAGVHYTRQDDRKDYGEIRKISTGLLAGNVVIVVWTERDDSRRIISMRKADRDERGEYYEQLD